MNIRQVFDTAEKKSIIEKCDVAFSRPITLRPNYKEVFEKLDKYAFFFAAENNAECVGYIAIYTNDLSTRVAYITILCVIPKMQRLQVGSLLLQKAIEAAHLKGMKSIRLEVYNDNTSALLFYKKHGFVFEKESVVGKQYMIRSIE